LTRIHLSIFPGLVLGLLLFAANLFSAELEWLPLNSSYPTPVFDPKSALQSLSMLNYNVEGEDNHVAYVPVTLSMRQQFVRILRPNERMIELGMSFSVFSQWSIVDVGEALMGGVQNTDYRISGIGTYRWMPGSYMRVSIFHQSSHLGDDYIIRNQITNATLRTLNYEQVDVSITKLFNSWQGYLGVGFNVSPHTVRGRSTFQLGCEYTRPLNQRVALKTGINMTVHEHNDFYPNLRAGLGVEVGRNTQTPFILMISAYKGHLPYSTLEFQKVQLLGLSLIIPLR